MLPVYGFALCQARTLQLTLPVYFLKRRQSTPSQLTGCRTGSAHSCIYFHWVPSRGGNCNSLLNLDSFSLVSPNLLVRSQWPVGLEVVVMYHFFFLIYTCWWWVSCVLLLIKSSTEWRAEEPVWPSCGACKVCMETIRCSQIPTLPVGGYRPQNNAHSFATELYTNILTSSRKGHHYSMLWLVNCVEFVSWSGTFSYVTMFGHVE